MPHTTSAGTSQRRRAARRRPPARSGGELRYRRRIARWVPWSKWSSTLSSHCLGHRPGRRRWPRAETSRSVQPAGGAHRQLARAAGRAPDARGAVPAVAGQERHRVDDHQPLDALGVALGEGQADGAPVVHDEAHALDARARRGSARGSGRTRRSCSVREPGLPERPKPGRSGARPPVRSRNGDPVVGVGRHAVQVERAARRCSPSGAGALRQNTRQPVDLAAVLARPRARGRGYSGRRRRIR